MLHLLWMAIFGLIIGALAKFAMPGKWATTTKPKARGGSRRSLAPSSCF